MRSTSTRKKLEAAALVFFTLTFARGRVARADDLRVEDAVKLALANNERAKKTPLRVEQAEGQLDKARSTFFPALTAGASQQWRFQEDRNGRSTSNAGTLTITQPLLNPSAFPQYSQQSHQLESEKFGAAQDRRQLAFETAKAFLQTLTAERVAEAAQSRLDRARANLQNAEARAAAGLASINDATRASLDVANAARDVATAMGNAKRARVQLAFLCGTEVKGTLAPPDRTTSQAQAVDVASRRDLDAARDRRPDVRAAHERTEALRASAREPTIASSRRSTPRGRCACSPIRSRPSARTTRASR